jgi:hypothetical protein
VDEEYEPTTENEPEEITTEFAETGLKLCHKADYFSFTLAEQASVKVCVSSDATQGDLDLSVTDENGSGSVSLSSDGNEEVSVTNQNDPDEGTKDYVIKVFAKTGTLKTSYDLKLVAVGEDC